MITRQFHCRDGIYKRIINTKKDMIEKDCLKYQIYKKGSEQHFEVWSNVLETKDKEIYENKIKELTK